MLDRRTVLALLICVGLGGAAGRAAAPGSLWELLDFESIPRVKDWRTYQASGYDRGGGFYDSGNFLRVEPGQRYVLMESDGPGCIDRMWFTYKRPLGQEPYDLLVYIDGGDEPAIRMDLDALFSGQRAPFVAPLAGTCAAATTPGRYSYVPIAFAKSCKVVLVPTAAPDVYLYRTNSLGETIPHVYYQITYRRFRPGTKVQPFQWEMTSCEQEALAKVQSLWSDGGRSPWGPSTPLLRRHGSLVVKARDTGTLLDIQGGGTLCELRLSAENPAGLRLLMTWDGAAAQVSAPLGPFFGCSDAGPPAVEVKGLWMGLADGWFYCYLPMPFHTSAKIEIANDTDAQAAVTARAGWIARPPDDDAAHFHARRYDHALVEPGRDYEVLDVTGRGHFVGLVMDRPGHMEGDDSFFVDGAREPVIRGTGTEDFFNFAWGLSHTGAYALHGITIQGGPVCYRMHIPATVPFARSLKISWEHGHDVRTGPNTHQDRYSGVVFYYVLGE